MPNPNAVYITPNNRMKPYGTIVAHNHITNHNSLISNKMIPAELWGETIYCFNNCHT
jgi:hypothetical protein